MLSFFIGAGVALLVLFGVTVRTGDERLLLLFIGAGVALLVLSVMTIAVALLCIGQTY